MNVHGIITFDGPFTSPYIRPVQLLYNKKVLAPYWSGTDTRGTGKIFYRQTAEPILLARATREIHEAFPTSQNVTIKNLFIVTWDAVGYYSMRRDKVNDTSVFDIMDIKLLCYVRTVDIFCKINLFLNYAYVNISL